MIEAIKNFFESNLAKSDSESREVAADKMQLTCAALLIEVMNSDHEQDAREMEEFTQVLRDKLHIEANKLDEVIALAKMEANQATSLYEFTVLINENYSYDEKLVLMENLWRVAFSDQKLDKYEDNLIRKIAELIYVTHSDFIRTKLIVRDNLT